MLRKILLTLACITGIAVTLNAQDSKEELMEAYTIVEKMPSFPGGEAEMFKFLASNIQYPSPAKTHGIQGMVIVTFVVEKNGEITNVNYLKGIGAGCDEEAIRVVSSMPTWSPGLLKGEPVRVQYNLPIRFILQDPLGSTLTDVDLKTTQKDFESYGEIFTIVEIMPVFPGGEKAMTKFISNNLEYPQEAIDKGVEGMVVASFVIERDGTLSNIKILRDIGFGSGEEAERIIGLMPSWQPGLQRGKPVKVQYNLPIRFKLTKKLKNKKRSSNG